ncbi:hypothetical protein HanIR_Chr06g0268291 [Helianthus annuus]|nr:hypothetical protein HanIR_Chr06g0268291 [Helianthus annuus]
MILLVMLVCFEHGVWLLIHFSGTIVKLGNYLVFMWMDISLLIVGLIFCPDLDTVVIVKFLLAAARLFVSAAVAYSYDYDMGFLLITDHLNMLLRGCVSQLLTKPWTRAMNSQVVPVAILKILKEKFHQERELGKILDFRNTGILSITNGNKTHLLQR